MSSNPSAQDQSLRKALKDAQEQILELEKRARGEASDDDVPAYTGSTSQELVLANEGLTNQNIGLQGRLEHAHALNQALMEEVKMLKEELKKSRAVAAISAPVLQQHFGSDSKSSHQYATTNIQNLTINFVERPDPAMTTTTPRPIADKMDVDVKKPTYSEHCRREQLGQFCQVARCNYWHKSQQEQWGSIRYGLHPNRDAANKAGVGKTAGA